MRYSAAGYWGNAVYFAVNSSYSNNYAYQTGMGQKQMFYAKVNVGHFKDLNQARDSNLKVPPPIDPQTLINWGLS